MKKVVVAKVFLENARDQILILRRSHTAPRRAFEWDLPGGWVEPGEEPLTAAIRELAEEAGIVINSLEEVLVTTDERDEEVIIRHYHIGVVDNPVVSLSYEHDRYKWVSKQEFAELMQYAPHVNAFHTIFTQ